MKSKTVNILIAINILVYIIWNFFPAYLPFMIKNFLVSWESLADGRFWTLVTPKFSHNIFIHILFNMMVLKSFGPVVEAVIGTQRFLKFYFVAGIVSSFSHAVVSNFLIGNPQLPALGASGSLAGMILVFSLLFPKEKILLFGIIPLPAILGAVLFIGLDLWGLFAQSTGGGLPIGHGAHLGGAFTGIIYYFTFLRKKYFTGKPFAE